MEFFSGDGEIRSLHDQYPLRIFLFVSRLQNSLATASNLCSFCIRKRCAPSSPHHGVLQRRRRDSNSRYSYCPFKSATTQSGRDRIRTCVGRKPQLAFQASAFDRSATLPLYVLDQSRLTVAVHSSGFIQKSTMSLAKVSQTFSHHATTPYISDS